MLSIPVEKGLLKSPNTTAASGHRRDSHSAKPDALWGNSNEAIATLGLSGREEASAKWRRQTAAWAWTEFLALPVEASVRPRPQRGRLRPHGRRRQGQEERADDHMAATSGTPLERLFGRCGSQELLGVAPGTRTSAATTVCRVSCHRLTAWHGRCLSNPSHRGSCCIITAGTRTCVEPGSSGNR